MDDGLVIHAASGGNLVCRMIDPRIEEYPNANAEHIVCCVNAHDDLLTALRDLVSEVDKVDFNGDGITFELEAKRDAARAVLAKAEIRS
jgi:hypothetical protein